MRRQSFTRSRIRYTRWAAVAALVPLALAGCSSGSDDTASEGATGTASGGVQVVSPGHLTVCTHLELTERLVQTLDDDDLGRVVTGSFVGDGGHHFAFADRASSRPTRTVRGSVMSR